MRHAPSFIARAVGLGLVLALVAVAQADPVPAPAPLAPDATSSNPALDARLRELELELRCLVCQNQTLADSNAGLAEDLRREIRARAEAGASDADIKKFLQERYGNFVLYRPPVVPETWVLWFGPFVLLLAVVGFLLWRALRPQSVAPAPALSADVRAAVEQLLE